ncbi:MAG: Type 1 glutamine amidotransferase-like domain-containing protein [Bacteroidota bacterium]
MKFYLSSYKFGNVVDQLMAMRPEKAKIGHINNARDWVGADLEYANKKQGEEMAQLHRYGFLPEALDLKDYFGKQSELEQKIDQLDALWVSGGNTFVLRMAMRISGFDQLVHDLNKRDDFLYAGYSAGVCVLADSLRGIENDDDPYNFPYAQIQEPSFDGLGIFNYIILPHYDSDHPESEEIAREVQRCIEQKRLFKVLRDGEVIIIQ